MNKMFNIDEPFTLRLKFIYHERQTLIPFLRFLPHRYGREDEEVMGLKFCNEAIIALQQIWPKIETEPPRFELTPLQVSTL